ncbi:microfibril-associated glycoprotein 4-like [Pelmatolapia mariae]|uniref:microfibril-associated glycoprotein 4-like n=1 Tax=Pelmatolapia mariae TaxID=158779 RepID=UPI002FE5D9ED
MDTVSPSATCWTARTSTNKISGVYTINPIRCTSAVQLYCDMDTDGGHWTVIQRRMDASVHFYMSWEAYRSGFGNAAAEYWLGLENIQQMTRQQDSKLRADMEDFEGNKVHALYSSFEVAAECDGYKLTVYGFSEGCTDSLTYHNGEKFSTFDKDQDSSSTNCAKLHMGGFWFKDCQEANPNRIYTWGRDSTMPNFGVEILERKLESRERRAEKEEDADKSEMFSGCGFLRDSNRRVLESLDLSVKAHSIPFVWV